MKTCASCGILKPYSEFHARSRAKDGLQSRCKLCNKEQRKAYYRTATGKSNSLASGKRYRYLIIEKMIEYLKQHPCVDCNESDPIVLEFDHRDPSTKLFNISTGLRLGYGWGRLLDEVQKCDVRCANCHKRRTAIQFGWIKGR